jgi:hypothetical protein
MRLGGRAIHADDFDRSGWTPGAVVEPLLIPLPELTPGEHSISIEVLDIRPKDTDGAYGYWLLSAVVIADESWQ